MAGAPAGRPDAGSWLIEAGRMGVGVGLGGVGAGVAVAVGVGDGVGKGTTGNSGASSMVYEYQTPF